METTNIQSPAATAATAAMAPVASLAPVPSMTNTPTPAAPVFPVLSPGHQSSEFYLALVVVATIVAALWAGKLDPTLASALLGLIVSGYPTLRTWLKAQHVDAMADVLAVQMKTGGGAVALSALAGAVGRPSDTADGSNGNEGTNGTGVRANPVALTSLALLGALLISFPGCAQTPYYVSGINGTVDTSKDGSQLTGGGVGVTISPNPYYPSPRSTSSGQASSGQARALSSKNGLAK